jgi:glyceraldehyde 3-phosphate dehydrogenase
MVLFKINCLIKKRAILSIYINMQANLWASTPFFDSVEIARRFGNWIYPAKLDIGKLTYEYLLDDEKYPDARHFVLDKLKTQNLQKKSNLRCCSIWFCRIVC